MVEKRKVALVLSGGGARGMAHIGVIECLEESGFEITSIAGTSIGALVGGIYACGKLNEFKEYVLKTTRFDVIRLMDLAIGKNGLIRGEKVFQELSDFLVISRIENLPLPYVAIAVDILENKEIVFTEGSLKDAIRASISIPTVFRPKQINEKLLVDGGVLNPLPLKHVTRSSDDLLIAVDLNASISYTSLPDKADEKNGSATYLKALDFVNEKWSKFFKNGNTKSIGFFDLITQSIYTMQVRLTQMAIEKYKPDLIIPISKKSCEMFEFHRAEELIKYGRKQMEEALIKSRS